MAFVLADRVRETTTTAGTGAVSLGGAVSGFQSFSTAIGNANNTYYTIADSNTGAWEVGIGTYTSSGNTLSRDTVLSSSNSGNLVNFAANAKDVFVTQPASRAVFVQDAGTGLQTGTTAFTANRILYANAASTTTTSANLTFDGTTLVAANFTDSSLTSGRVTYATTGGNLTDSANMTFDGTRLTVADFADSGLTPTRVVYSTTGGALTDSANLTFDGSKLSVYGVEVGRGAGANPINTAVGAGALQANTTGANNSAFGYQALYNTTTGSLNTAVGFLSLSENITNGSNTAVGNNSAGRMRGSDNTAVGESAMIGSVTAASNTGQQNVAIGKSALRNITSGTTNTAIGFGSGSDITTGSKNIILGPYTGNNYGLDIRTANNYIVLSDGDGNPRQYWDGTNWNLSGSAVFSGGTANGVAYLNGSKVLTTGSALTFDGTRLYVNGAQGLGSTGGVVQAVGSYLSYGDNAGLRLLNTAANGGGTIFALTGLNGGVSIGGDGGPLVFSASGSEGMRLTSTGLGIGTTTTTNGRLTAQAGTSATGNSAFFSNADGTYNPYLQIQHSSAGIKLFNSSSFGSASNNLIFGNGGTAETMRIDGSGNLGIGTSSPAYRLQVQSAGTGTTAASNIVGRFQTNGSGYDVFVQLSDNVANSGGIGMVGGAMYLANGTTRNLTLDSSGNLGLGVTPSAWGASGKAFELANGTFLVNYANSSQAILGANSYYTGSNWIYKNTAAASNYEQLSGAHRWFTAPSGTAGTAISFTQAMTLDASGNLGVGTTSPGSFIGTVKLVVGSAATTTTPGAVTVYSGTATYGGLYFADGTVGDQLYRGAVEYNHSTDALLLYSAGSERARIDSSGNLGLGVTPSAWGSSYKALQIGARGSLYAHASVGATLLGENVYDDGTAKYIASAAASRYQLSGGVHYWYTAPSGTAGNAISFTQAMTLDASGNLLLATTSTPAYGSKLRVQGGIETFASQFNVVSGTSTQFELVNRSATAGFDFYVNSGGTLAARITSGGDLLVGTTSSSGRITLGDNTGGVNGFVSIQSVAGGYSFLSDAVSNGGTYYHMQFKQAATPVGSITSTGSTTSYNTSSDYRLKNITGPITNSGVYIDSLKPVEGTWKSDGSTFVGLIAHETQKVSRTSVVTGEKDGEQMQSMSYSSPEMIANIIAELQSLRARVAQLESKGA